MGNGIIQEQLTEDGIDVRAPAKINLGLRVGPATGQGYHAIRTVFQSISLCDRLTFGSSDTGSDELLATGDVSVPSNSDNLILRALNLLREDGISVPPLRINLEKRIPTEAGLGGGSSDAAAVLRTVNEFFEVGLDHEDLVEYAVQLGSDVPFFLKGGTQLGTGRGDRLQELPALEGQGILCVPPYGVSTEWAYSEINPRSHEELNGIVGTDVATLTSWKQLDLSNDFESQVTSSFPQHEKFKGILAEYSSSIAMTGSGSALYALVDKSFDLSDSLDRLSSEYDACRWYKFEFIPRF